MRDERQRIETEHVETRRLAERLAQPETLAALRGDARALMAFLPAHFHREEGSDGLFAHAVMRAPDEAWRFEELRDKHARMLEELEELLALLERDDPHPVARPLARELGRQLLEHDQLEAAWIRLMSRTRDPEGGTNGA